VTGGEGAPVVPAGRAHGVLGVAVLLPGTGYTVQGPLLAWAGQVLADLGWTVEPVAWTVDEAAERDPEGFAASAVEAAFARAEAALPEGTPGARLVVAKSFGCSALPWALERDVPGAWLTPVTTYPPVRAALARADDAHWAVGGGVDPLWRPDGLRTAGAGLTTVPAADHGLRVPGDWRAGVEAHRRVLERLESWAAR